MRFSAILIGSVAPTLIAAHGKIAVVQGDAGGNGTAIGIQGGIIPGPGKNKVTEPDTTVFGKTNIATDGLGKTKGSGKNTVAMVADTMAQSGSTLPQVTDGGMITGTFHIVTTDGAGPVSAMIDPTGTGAFSAGVEATVMQDVPGNKGNIKANGQVPRSLEYWTLRARGLVKRASNVNQDYPIAIQVPAGTTCSGTAAGQQNVCFMKIANSNKAGPFGGVIAFQMAGGAAAGATGSTGSTTSTGSNGNAQGGAGAAGNNQARAEANNDDDEEDDTDNTAAASNNQARAEANNDDDEEDDNDNTAAAGSASPRSIMKRFAA
ncbi:hypothetical protein N0V95_001615 [Ascochyta clinopodiicola]|nr:hypothetical protein N0V95_001615 [Ascochyta clinopodiicola]